MRRVISYRVYSKFYLPKWLTLHTLAIVVTDTGYSNNSHLRTVGYPISFLGDVRIIIKPVRGIRVEIP